LAATFGRQVDMEFVLLFTRGTLAWVLVSAGIQKLWRGESGPDEPPTLASRLPKPVGYGLVSAELVTGLGLFLTVVWPYAAFGAAVLFAAFTAAVAREAWRGAIGDCGCGGLLPSAGISYKHAALTGTAAALALLVATAGFAPVGNLNGSGGVVGNVIVMTWAPLVMLLGVNAGRQIINARQIRVGIDRRVWGESGTERA
jgi:hypothetical protein